MAETVVPLGDPTAVVIYSHRVFQQAIKATIAAKLMAVSGNPREANNFVQWFDEPAKGPGDTVKYDLVPNPIGPGVLGDAPIAGQEVTQSALQDSFVINQQRQATLLKGRMSQQRVPYSMRDVGKVGLGNWWKENIDTGILNQLGGNTFQTDVSYTAMNATIAPDTAHWTFAGGVANEAALGSSNVFSINAIPDLVARAQSSFIFPLKPITIKGVEVAGLMFLHPLQVKALKTNFTTGEWGDIHRAALSGGQVTGNPLFTGAIGMYENVVLHQDARVPYGSITQNVIYDSVAAATVPAPTALGVASVARAIFVGAQALAFATGSADAQGGTNLRVRWYEELLDAGNQLRLTAGMMWGAKKTRFASQDYGVQVHSTWAA